jgi:hypothetical protein
MARSRTATNPFYVVLVIVGVVFLITACSYGVMAFRADRLARAATMGEPSSPLLILLRDRGGQLLAGELVLLGLTTVAAMATDAFWTRRGEGHARSSDQGSDE